MPIYPAILLSPIMRIQSLEHDKHFAILKPSTVASNLGVCIINDRILDYFNQQLIFISNKNES